jgi:hypothetical protein
MLECENCFYPFPRYATTCPACKEARWLLCYVFIHPHPDRPEFPERYTSKGEMDIPSAGLKVLDNADGTVRLIQADPETGSWEAFEKPFGDIPMKPVGYYWINEYDWEWRIPVENFPPMSPEDARDRHFYEEACKPKSQKLTDETILARAKREHPEWDCQDSIQWMRQRRKKYQQYNDLPEIPKRPYKRT